MCASSLRHVLLVWEEQLAHRALNDTQQEIDDKSMSPNRRRAHHALDLRQHHVVIGEEEPARRALDHAQRECDDVDEQDLQPEARRGHQRLAHADLRARARCSENSAAFGVMHGSCLARLPPDRHKGVWKCGSAGKQIQACLPTSNFPLQKRP